MTNGFTASPESGAGTGVVGAGVVGVGVVDVICVSTKVFFEFDVVRTHFSVLLKYIRKSKCLQKDIIKFIKKITKQETHWIQKEKRKIIQEEKHFEYIKTQRQKTYYYLDLK